MVTPAMKPDDEDRRDLEVLVIFLCELALSCVLLVVFVVTQGHTYWVGSAFAFVCAMLIAKREGWK